AELIGQQRGKAGTRLVRGRPLQQGGWLAGLFFLGAVSVAGLPPLSGALGKALLLAAAEGGQRLWLWPILLLTGLCALIALSRAGSTLFWRSQGEPAGERLTWRKWFGVTWLLAASPLLVALAGPVSDYTEATADQLAAPQALIDALLPSAGGAP
ncbi:MAG: monovalent cation/H+ antiporter subunit D, partial [Halomonas sp.]|nr:monovalent cation/H+ antiporter subunit D [Halomonas sp.]MDX5502660.1 monovalent cation/H+ antiporter subunit D [Halomonas sp.]